MTVTELVKHLQALDPEMHVFVNGYEGGYNDVELKGPFDIALDVNTDWWYGKHEKISKFKNETNYKVVKGVVL